MNNLQKFSLLSALVLLTCGCSNKMCYEYQKYVVVYHNDDLPVVSDQYKKEISSAHRLTADEIEKIATQNESNKTIIENFKDGRLLVTRHTLDEPKDENGKKRCSYIIDIYEILVQDNVQHELGASYFSTDSAGASFRSRGWEHTLNSSSIKKSNDYIWNLYNPSNIRSAKNTYVGGSSGSGNTVSGKRSSGDLSVYDLLHWNHYCNGGKNMTEDDFLYVTNQGENSMPITIKSCSTPKFTFDEYKSAWSSFCAGKDLTSNQSYIINLTKRPKANKNCPRIFK